MSFLLNYAFGQQPAPKRIPTDTVIPMNSHDDRSENKNITVELTLRFDDVLDAQKLADALWKLLEKPRWKRLGARLRINSKTGRLENHVPAQYTKDRPPIDYTQKTYDMKLQEHAVWSRFPKVKDNDCIQSFENLPLTSELTPPEGGPKVLEYWTHSDKALLGLDIANFQDATLVTVTWLHTLMDALGLHTLLQAWIAVLEGRDEDVPELWDYDVDYLEELGTLPSEEEDEKKPNLVWTAASCVKDWISRLPRLPSFKLILAILHWRIFQTPKAQCDRKMYIPASSLARIRKEAMSDLASLDPSQITYNTSAPPKTTPFLSDGDIITAWLMRHLVTSDHDLPHYPPTRPILFLNVLEMRDVLSEATGKYKVLIPKNTAYIGNATAALFSHFTLRSFLGLPLGHIAAKIRKDVVDQGNREALEAAHRNLRRGRYDHILPPGTTMIPKVIVMTNWNKARFFETDFSAALVHSGSEGSDEGKKRGRPTYCHTNGIFRRLSDWASLAHMTNVVGRDAKGGYWVTASMSKDSEERFMKVIVDG
ncbi:hypothetical protein COCC4DRAFT_142432 [Bipolaris maydis ATCC 48331]|uniref:Uncharacterized protein n=2 Tax=Cochliobolus heterostrophus TaxID=5016 RepID=M2VAK8_COCH5|nr:uncharacterized protein COCC4DRAFT_142432 [Bipolaris maydis ATCC 48331]EMD96738.1 hypothetical protein COCHEDRAFT_1162738 [Bipolaris maydis C5]KAJ5060574.1 hypothetical protein J3E74DRAFT_245232 [Bipolaris maydis]ENI03605.1 hypothetical protein COCC4DRAFT_142432 [Bipolaris maydis ATCC 48331]KAJ6201599.1 hypothetical protein J3E72DRAFT_209023 [Bipolaris maydis]KAJ6211380.1 hypothetical protein PSV09DRAFT_1162738 [Bipolaris maydis]